MTKLIDIECIDPETIGAREVFDQYISKRIPVKFKSFPSDYPRDFNWDLVCKFPQTRVIVESKDKCIDRFGSGKSRTEMSIKEFNDQMRNGNLYLSTQYSVDQELSKVKQIIQAPLTELMDFFPLKPEIIGNLVPQQFTLWVGYNTGLPVSSGLHHDFHDNLYLLISGEKHFRLYSPHDAKYMYTVGKIRKVFSNGLISYVDNIREDGADLADVAHWRLKEAEIELAKAESGIGDLELAEQKVDDAMDELLKYSEFDDSPKVKKIKVDLDSEPNSFSRIKNTSDHKQLADFPKFQNATYYDITLKAGESLFLPAGWFHEVKSCGSTVDGVHMAMNYWMAPSTENDFDHPYQDGFWDSQWKLFLDELNEFKKTKA